MNNNPWTLILISLLAVGLAACGSHGRYSGTLITDGDHSLVAGEESEAGVLLLDGSYAIEDGARLAGSIFVLGGQLEVNGEIGGDLSMLEGKTELGPQALIVGDLIQAGGQLERAPEATVLGQMPTGQPQATDLFSASTGSSATVVSIMMRAIIQGLLAFAALRWLPRPINRTTNALRHHPFASGAVGILTGIIALILMVQMMFTVVLIPMSILLGVILLIAVGLAGIFYGHAIGETLRNQLRRELSAPLAAGLGAILFSVLSDALQFIPYAGAAVQLLLIATAIGALILTRFGLRTFSPASQQELI